MAQYRYHVGGNSHVKTIGGQKYDADQAFLRLSTDDKIDVVLPGDGVKTVLVLIKEAAMAMAQTQVPAEPGPEWDELLKVPANGIEVTITFGIGAVHLTPKAP